MTFELIEGGRGVGLEEFDINDFDTYNADEINRLKTLMLESSSVAIAATRPQTELKLVESDGIESRGVDDVSQVELDRRRGLHLKALIDSDLVGRVIEIYEEVPHYRVQRIIDTVRQGRSEDFPDYEIYNRVTNFYLESDGVQRSANLLGSQLLFVMNYLFDNDTNSFADIV